jgi:hypothetical protein
MNSKQPFGTRDFAGGAWRMTEDKKAEEAVNIIRSVLEKSEKENLDKKFNRLWNEAEELVNKMKRGLQYPDGGLDSLNEEDLNDLPGNPIKAQMEITIGFLKYNEIVADDLWKCVESLSGLSEDLKKAYIDAQRTDDPGELPDGGRR